MTTDIKKFAEAVAKGTYDQALPRPTDRTSLTVRQIAAQYPETAKRALGDEAGTSFWLGLIGGTIFTIAIMILTEGWFNPSDKWGTVLLDALLLIVLYLASTFVICVTTFIAIENKEIYSSQKLRRAQEKLLQQLEDDLILLADALGLNGFDSLVGYDRKMIIALAVDAGAEMVSASKRYQNSNDLDERKAAERIRKELDEFHALLGRLNLQPPSGFSAYGRQAAELKAKETQMAEID